MSNIVYERRVRCFIMLWKSKKSYLVYLGIHHRLSWCLIKTILKSEILIEAYDYWWGSEKGRSHFPHRFENPHEIFHNCCASEVWFVNRLLLNFLEYRTTIILRSNVPRQVHFALSRQTAFTHALAYVCSSMLYRWCHFCPQAWPCYCLIWYKHIRVLFSHSLLLIPIFFGEHSQPHSILKLRQFDFTS